ncbi:MAG: carboxypeptidase-like regulatory domain-containing protein, partial [Candidatus Aminicenantaceae bacterium]
MKISNLKTDKKILPARNVFAAILVVLLLSTGAHVTVIGSVSPGGQVDAFDRLLSEEEKGNFNDVLTTAKDSSSQAQEHFQTFLDKWEWLRTNFANLPEPVQNAFNKLNNAGIQNKVSSAKDFLGQFNSGIDKFYEGKGKVDSALNFLDRYAPDKSNPFRSLEVLKNLLDDAESLLPDDEKLKDPASKTIVWLIRTGIDYFRTGITGAYSGLKNVQKLIKDRAGNCIGYVGGDATEDSSDPRRKAFTDLETGDIICYTGIRPVGGEVWGNTDGNGVYIWFSGKWTKFSAGLGVVRDVFSMYRLAHGRAVTAEMIIELINNGLSNIQRAKTKGTENYRKLFERITQCQIDILEFIDSEDDRAQLLQESSNNKQEFIAKYVFNVGTIREMSEILVNVVDNYSMVSGHVMDKDGKAVANASFTFTAGQAKGVATSDNTGYFKTLVDANGSANLSATVTVTHPSYADFSETTRLYQQCQSVGQLKLKDKETEITGLTISPALPTIKVDETV